MKTSDIKCITIGGDATHTKNRLEAGGLAWTLWVDYNPGEGNLFIVEAAGGDAYFDTYDEVVAFIVGRFA